MTGEALKIRVEAVVFLFLFYFFGFAEVYTDAFFYRGLV
jgi:hypothetical protein